MRHFVEHSIGIVTALVPVIGYEQATSVAKEALETGQGVYDVVMVARPADARTARQGSRSGVDDGRPPFLARAEDLEMAGLRLDSAGLIKMKTLDDALVHLQRIHGIVEQYAIAVKRNQPSSTFAMNLRRQLPTLAANLKAQFGMVSEQVTALALASTRGSSENQRVRTLREGVAQLRQALEIAATQTKERHAVKGDAGPGEDGSGEHA